MAFPTSRIQPLSRSHRSRAITERCPINNPARERNLQEMPLGSRLYRLRKAKKLDSATAPREKKKAKRNRYKDIHGSVCKWSVFLIEAGRM